jgi:hypothetical protein
MNTRTWPYGTQKRVKVTHVSGHCLVCIDEGDEVHMLIGIDTDGAKTSDVGIITFTQGGPMGGYWKFERTS